MDMIDEAIKITSNRTLVAEQHSPWQVAHGVFALGDEMRFSNGEKAVDYALAGAVYRKTGEPWFVRTKYGAAGHAFTQEFIHEGHRGQILAYMTTADPDKCRALMAYDREKREWTRLTVEDLVEDLKKDPFGGDTEIAWVLMALAHYAKVDEIWKTHNGDYWSVQRLVQTQVKRSLTLDSLLRQPCRGAHGLYALGTAVKRYDQLDANEKKKLDTNTWNNARALLKHYENRIRIRQQASGHLSWYDEPSLDHTGHALEWILHFDPQARDVEWVRRACEAVSRDLVARRADPSIDMGHMYHALHALRMFKEPKPKGD